jgi:hypothetical protein
VDEVIYNNPSTPLSAPSVSQQRNRSPSEDYVSLVEGDVPELTFSMKEFEDKLQHALIKR